MNLARTLPFWTSFGANFIWSKLTGRGQPFLVQLNVTNRCNYHCAYCYGRYFERERKDMFLADVKGVLSALAAKGAFRINLVGGEPLMHPDIGDIIDHANDLGMSTAMTTNGALAPTRMDVLVKLGTVCFSLDGLAKNNDLGRAPGSHDKAIRGLETCKAAGVAVQLSAVLTKHTTNDVDYMVEIAKRYECCVGFTPLISQEREGRRTEHRLHPSREDLTQALSRIIELKRAGAPILFSERAYAHCRDWPCPDTDVLPGGLGGVASIPCLAGAYFCLVDANMDLYPCPQLIGRFKAKNILTDGLDACLEHAARHSCKACSIPCSNDFSLFFGLSPAVVLDQLGRLWRGL